MFNPFDPNYQQMAAQYQQAMGQQQSVPRPQMAQQPYPSQNDVLRHARRKQLMEEYFKTERGQKLNAELEADFEDYCQERSGVQKPIDYSAAFARQTEMIRALAEEVAALRKSKSTTEPIKK